MRERDALMASIMGLRQDTPEWRDRANRELDAYRDAILREEAAKLYATAEKAEREEWHGSWADGHHSAAAAIDPDASKETT